MVKIWGSSKNDQNRITGKLLKLQKFIFTILHLPVVFVVLLLLQFQLTYLKNRTELRNETLHTDRTTRRPAQRHVKCLVNNVVLVKQQ